MDALDQSVHSDLQFINETRYKDVVTTGPVIFVYNRRYLWP